MGSLNINGQKGYTEVSTTNGMFMHGNQRQAHLMYGAGILDADGCFMITKHNRKTPSKRKFINKEVRSPVYLPCVKIAMIELEGIQCFSEDLKYGKVHLDGVRKDRPNSKPIYQWYLRSSKNVLPLLEEIIPYLRVKKKRAQFLLEFCKKVSTKNVGYRGVDQSELDYREESYLKMREFNGNKAAATTESLRPERVSDSLAS